MGDAFPLRVPPPTLVRLTPGLIMVKRWSPPTDDARILEPPSVAPAIDADRPEDEAVW